MKILHINYSDKSGGAGIAAYRHNEAMNRIGLNSNMLVVLKMTRDNTIYVLRKNRVQLQVLDNLYNFLHSFVIRRFKPRADFCYALFGQRVSHLHIQKLGIHICPCPIFEYTPSSIPILYRDYSHSQHQTELFFY